MFKSLKAAYNHDSLKHRIAVTVAAAVAGGITTRLMSDLMDRVLSK